MPHSVIRRSEQPALLQKGPEAAYPHCEQSHLTPQRHFTALNPCAGTTRGRGFPRRPRVSRPLFSHPSPLAHPRAAGQRSPALPPSLQPLRTRRGTLRLFPPSAGAREGGGKAEEEGRRVERQDEDENSFMPGLSPLLPPHPPPPPPRFLSFGEGERERRQPHRTPQVGRGGPLPRASNRRCQQWKV